jgi:hypothetical protein
MTGRFGQGGGPFVNIPLWAPLLLAGMPTFWFWLRGRCKKPGHCQRCGYDLTGNTSGVCPECGAQISCVR